MALADYISSVLTFANSSQSQAGNGYSDHRFNAHTLSMQDHTFELDGRNTFKRRRVVGLVTGFSTSLVNYMKQDPFTVRICQFGSVPVF